MSRSIALIVAALLALAAGAPGVALAQSSDPNYAIAVNESDGSSLFEFAFDVQNVVGDTVDQQNGALAYSSCDACQTVAVAIQIVLVSSETTSTITPENEAIAINDRCTACSTVASAYQFVVGTGEPIRLTARGEAELRNIRKLLERLKKRFEDGKLTTEEIKGELADIRTRLERVVAEEIVPDDQKGDGRGRDEDDRDNAAGVPGAEEANGEVESAPEAERERPDDPSGPGTREAPTTTTTTPEPSAPPRTSTTPDSTGTPAPAPATP